MAVDTIESMIQPRVPSRREIGTLEEAAESLNEIQKWAAGIAGFNDSLFQILNSNFLIRSWRVESLEAGKITAGTITTDQLFLGSGNFTLDGVLSQIRIEDDQNPSVIRVEIGAFGSGSDYGIKVRDASGTVVFQSASTTFINGAAITNATITDSKINGVDGSKIFDGTVGNAKISDLSAGKITAGTLIVDGSPAIQVTSAGACLFTAGGDIIMRASASGDNNFISWRTSGNSERAKATYNASSNIFSFQTLSSAQFQLISAGTLRVSAPTIFLGFGSQNLNIPARLASSFLPDSHNVRSLGSASLKFANIHSVSTNFGDIGMENGVVQTEPDKVYSWADAQDGVLFMRPDRWHPFVWFHLDGNIQTKDFPEPDVIKKTTHKE